jgi:hypothetical protein
MLHSPGITRLRAQLIPISESKYLHPKWEMKRISIRENPTGFLMRVHSVGEDTTFDTLDIGKSSQDLYIRIRQQTKFLGLPVT